MQIPLFTLLSDASAHERKKSLIGPLRIIVVQHVIVDENFHFQRWRFLDLAMERIP